MGTYTTRLGRRLLWLVPVLALCACVADPPHVADRSSSSPVSSAPAGTPSAAASDDLSDSTWNARSAALGATATTDSGLAVHVSSPARMTRTAHAIGVRPHQATLVLVVSVTNGQPDPFDLRLLTLSATSGPAQAPCAAVRDDATGVGVRTTASLPPGGTTRWRAGFSCPGAAGQPLVVAFTPRAGFADLEFTGQLP